MSRIHVTIESNELSTERVMELEEAIEMALTFLNCGLESAESIERFLDRRDWMDLAYSLSNAKGI